ncbi:unnamed protein product [Heligmosomoides polygyrus]|uniref:DUF1758 domain-containing protein n=1 Tax=Heligmosomoides polygyrus TaxID=6339 RepID=A0A183FM32_HELPZ|nr:unnamed protein product [Heligmosomoides polygyrus]
MDNGSRPQPSYINGRPRSPQARETTKARRENRPRTHPNRAMVNEIEEDERSEEESDPEEREEVCHVTGSHEGKKRTTLLTGMAKILGEEKDIDVRILLDTGSELSFIDTQLIKDLNLPVVGKTKLKIRTFGQTTVEEIQYPVTQVLLEDKLGKVHELRLYGSKTIASKVKRPILSEDDWLFIKERGLDLTEEEVEESQPRILLGCDLLWDFVNGLKVKLPSGIYAISTLFGYMLSGSQSSQNNSTRERQVMCTSNLSEEAELWDTYWKMDSVGINEYPGPEKTEKQRCDEEVWRNFCDTTVKRSDGYYVRLPWKQQHEPLPDNYKIALARLKGTYNRYRGDPTMMEKYDEVFKDQVQKGILEEVFPEEMQTKNTVHYLSHQAVLTPSKTTTKIRIVFDASAHYSGKPSLNDDAELDSVVIIRPIDFIQKDMVISSSCDPQEETNYLSTQEASKLRTKSQAKEALKDSVQRVDKFWAAWQDYYLKELREFHKKNLQEGKTSAKTPSPGEVVLVSSSILPRNSWKLGRILDVVRSEDGQIRETELRIGGGGTIRRPPNLLIPLEIRQETGQRSEDTSLEEETREREVPDRQDQTYNLRPQRRPRYPFDEAEYEVYQLQIIEESEKNCVEKTIAGTADNLKSVASSASFNVRTSPTFFRMADEDLKKCIPVSDDEEEEDLLDLGDFDEEEEKEDSPTDEPEGQESEEGDEADKPPVDEPEEIEEEEKEEKEEARPLTRNDLVSFGVRTLKLVQNIGTRQQVLLESLKEQTEDRLNRIEKKLTAYQIRTEYMLSVLMYGEEDETESVTDQPTTSRRTPTEGEPLPKKKREAFEVRVAASQLNSLVECPERRILPGRGNSWDRLLPSLPADGGQKNTRGEAWILPQMPWTLPT